ncbi:MAG TPA: hypothetical protein VN794_18045 [Methylomirabilota bacterium]|jgi:hypothetical protein|nr:hypothetical protein [Methylomirabilota bacterium]
MPYRPPLIALLACALIGCHKQETPAPNPAQAPVTPEAPASAQSVPQAAPQGPPPGARPLPAPPPVVAARADNYVRQNIDGQVDPFLSEQLRTFIDQKKRFPESFAEFAMTRLDSIPRPPEGKRWVIDAASLQVKAVPK